MHAYTFTVNLTIWEQFLYIGVSYTCSFLRTSFNFYVVFYFYATPLVHTYFWINLFLNDLFSGKSKRTLSLEKVNHWITLGRYTRLDQLQKDLLLLFQQARQIEAEMDNEVDKIIISLEKEYVKTRDRICSSLLWSPAYEERTIKFVFLFMI